LGKPLSVVLLPHIAHAGIRCRRVGRFYNLALKLGRATPFNMIWELQQFASALAYSQVKDPKVYVDPSYEWISIGTETLRLDLLRGGMDRLVKTIKEQYVLLSGDAAWPGPWEGPVVDDLSNVRRGYCFLEESPFKGTKHSFFLSAVEKHKLGAFTVAREWTWDRNAIRRFLDRADKIWGHVIHALYIGLQLSTRATQFLQHQIRNADRPRNLIFQGKEGLFISRYSKTTSMKGRDSCVPAFLTPVLAEIMLVLLGSGFREAQAVLSGIEHGEESRWLYRT
jgi:hypothetical protein